MPHCIFIGVVIFNTAIDSSAMAVRFEVIECHIVYCPITITTITSGPHFQIIN